MIKLENGAYIPKVFEENFVPVCFSANNSYVSQTAVMIKSIINNSRTDKNYDFIILSTDINEENEQILQSFIGERKNISIRIFDISVLLDDVEFFTDSVYTPTTYSKEAYFRLFIPFAMDEYEKVVYFDGDMTVASDISSVMDIDITNYLAAATRDYCGIAACYDTGSDRLEYRKEIGIKVPDDYFISSMVIVNISKFKEKYSLSYLKSMISSRNWRQHDQDIFNVLCQDELLIIGAEWSFFEEFDYSLKWLPKNLQQELLESREKAIVVHYAGANKAWVDDNSDLTGYFWQSAADTPYFTEFYNKIPDDKVSYKYHIFKNVLKREIEYCCTANDILMFSEHKFIGAVSQLKICVEFLDVKYDVATFEGWYEDVDLLGQLRLFAKVNGKGIITEISNTHREYGTRSSVKKIRPFKATVWLDPQETVHKISFGLTYDDVTFVEPQYISVEQFAPINEYHGSFYPRGDYIVTKKFGTTFVFEPYSRKQLFKYNGELCKYLSAKKEKYFKKMSMFRWLYYLTKPKYRNKNVWLLSDTVERVDENTIGLFKYLKERKDIDVYLVVSPECEQYRELKKLGRVIKARSKKHKLLYFHASVVISSEYSLSFFMPAYDRANEIRDLVANKKFVYIAKNGEDLSYNVKPWYNIHKFIFDNEQDYKKMLELDNGYNEAHLCLIDKTLEKRWLYNAIYGCISED